MKNEDWVTGEFEDERPQTQAIDRHQPQGVQVYETASAALAAAARANVEARFLVAQTRPRNLDEVRVRLLKDCKRPRFAEAARYAKPVGRDKIEGPSARFAEAALRHLGNLDVQNQVIYDDDRQRIVRVTATDLETNATTSGDVTIAKTVERRQLREGQVPLGRRSNSYGDPVFIVAGTDDEVANKVGAAVSKMRRNLILQLLPADILEESMEMAKRVMRERDKADPDAARKRLIDAFAEIGVKPSQLEEFLGHPTEQLLPRELDELRGIFAAVKDGETTWRAVMEAKTGEKPADEGAPAKPSAAKQRAQEIVERQRAKKKAGAEPPKSEPAAAQPVETAHQREIGEEG